MNNKIIKKLKFENVDLSVLTRTFMKKLKKYLKKFKKCIDKLKEIMYTKSCRKDMVA